MSISGAYLIEHGWPQSKAIGEALHYYHSQLHAGDDPQCILKRLEKVHRHPEIYADSAVEGPVARALIKHYAVEAPALREEARPYGVWGIDLIDQNTLEQMNTAMKLPVALEGALLPDAHLGYGLPVGGVLGTDPGVVIPWAVGVDIGCRMHMSIFDVDPYVLDDVAYYDLLKGALISSTNFGAGGKFKPKRRSDHEVLADPLWESVGILRDTRETAEAQLGTSGGGNHFVEWGIYKGVDGSEHLGLLSHSGSRGFGYKVANYFSKIAKRLHPNLPTEAKDLGWLDLSAEEGDLYWRCMQLAGDYARANHQVIHEKVARYICERAFHTVDHHHNYAWLESHGGVEMMVHRKGATPAKEGELGIIPGDTRRPGYVVSGTGNEESLASASHGAGRLMSRTQAHNTLDASAWKRELEEHRIELIGGGLDEASGAYKSVSEVIVRQRDLVNIVGEFKPVLVRMAPSGAGKRRY